MTERIYNFSAGPAVLPLPVLEKAQSEMLSLPGVGMSVMEISHRSKTFDEIMNRAEGGLRRLMNVPDDYHILFLQGGASLQFSMIPMNFLKGGTADYIVTGSWGKKAVKEAKREGAVNIAGTTQEEGFKRTLNQNELKLDSRAAYCHFTTNETIEGVEWFTEPDAGDVPLIADASSDICSRPVDVSKYALIYAGAQKNLGPSGVTVVILRNDLLSRITGENLHTVLDYRTQVENKSLYNTPNTWGVYIIALVCEWLEERGGLAGIERENRMKAEMIYNQIDATEFYRGHAERDSRSIMNVTFRLPSEDLEKEFAKQATAEGLDGLKGHRSVGGMRASIYNAFPREGVEKLVDFMREFERKNG
jgi:phosphoserine aminotransferase